MPGPTRRPRRVLRPAPAHPPPPRQGAAGRPPAVGGGSPPSRRPLVTAVAVGAGVGLAAGLMAFSLLAVPLFALARTDPNGLDREVVRTGLFGVAVPLGLGVAVTVGALVGVWLRRGGRLPGGPTSFHETGGDVR